MWYNPNTTSSFFFGARKETVMSSKRRDSKGRVLRNGETQRPDGMYMYRFNDAEGVRRTIYSWRLVASDKLPAGKRACEPLRELERQVARDADDLIKSFQAKGKTLNDLFSAYMEIKKELKLTTRAEYFRVYNRYLRKGLGLKNIASISYSDIKTLYQNLYASGKQAGTIHNVSAILSPVFTLAVRDGYIRANPARSVYAETAKHNGWSVPPKRHALTIEQQEAFIAFVRDSPMCAFYLPLFTTFLGTGCRVGELAALRWEDCDFSEDVISIRHSLAWCKPEGEDRRRFVITTPKTGAGKREIPMLREVRSALLRERVQQMSEGFSSIEIDGYSGFIFQSRNGKPLHSGVVNPIIRRIIKAYNEKETRQAALERRPAILLPHFSAHSLRHTFCTRFCENETNLKVIQEIMGHANIATTMDVYNEATMEKKKSSMESLEGKVRIS